VCSHDKSMSVLQELSRLPILRGQSEKVRTLALSAGAKANPSRPDLALSSDPPKYMIDLLSCLVTTGWFQISHGRLDVRMSEPVLHSS